MNYKASDSWYAQADKREPFHFHVFYPNYEERMVHIRTDVYHHLKVNERFVPLMLEPKS